MTAEDSAAELAPIDRHEDAGRSLNRFTTWLLVGYLVFIVLLMIVRRAAVSPDVFFVFVSVIAVMLGRGKLFIRDWAPFVLLFSRLGGDARHRLSVRGRSPIGLSYCRGETDLFRHCPARCAATVAIRTGANWAARNHRFCGVRRHFLLPLTVAFLLWVKRRAAYYRYVIALMVMSFAQFFTAILLPVAPPRFSGQYGEALPIVDIGGLVSKETGIGVLSWAYHNINANPVAAFPSLHAAYPILAYLFLREYWPRWSWLMLVYAGVASIRGGRDTRGSGH